MNWLNCCHITTKIKWLEIINQVVPLASKAAKFGWLPQCFSFEFFLSVAQQKTLERPPMQFLGIKSFCPSRRSEGCCRYAKSCLPCGDNVMRKAWIFKGEGRAQSSKKRIVENFLKKERKKRPKLNSTLTGLYYNILKARCNQLPLHRIWKDAALSLLFAFCVMFTFS